MSTNKKKDLWLHKTALTFPLTIALLLVSIQASAITLVRCKVNNKTVYSDTDCPEVKANTHRHRKQSDFSSGTPSRKVTVHTQKNATAGMKVPRARHTSHQS